jgi:hypothetical protein
VSTLTGNDWQAKTGPAAEPARAASQESALRDRLTVLRDTLIAFSMQLSFRVTMFLRHLNY